MFKNQKGGDILSEIKERIKAIRKELNKTQEELGSILGITREGVASIESGRRNVTEKHIKFLCIESIDGKYVNEEWLRTGEGDMFKKLLPMDEVAEYVGDLLDYDGEGNPFYDTIIEMMRTYRKLDDKSKIVIREYFRNVGESIAKKREG